MREMPKGSPFRFVAGIQLRFSGTEDRQEMQEYVSYVKKRYKL
jgi:cytochrome c2